MAAMLDMDSFQKFAPVSTMLNIEITERIHNQLLTAYKFKSNFNNKVVLFRNYRMAHVAG